MADNEKGCWFTTKTGVHVFVKDGQTVEDAIKERFEEKGKEASPKDAAAKKMTPAEKIASVHIDFDKDNVLPELEEDSLQAMGVKKSKKVLVKAGTILRNADKHPDVKKEEAARIIGETLYSPKYSPYKSNDEKPYFTFIKPMAISQKDGSEIYGLTILDVDVQKEYFEVVHWHWVRERSLKTKK